LKERYNRDVASQLVVSRLVPVIAHAVAVFGDEHKASHWFATPLAFFGGRAPSEMLETDDGLALVEQTLSRIEHNVFS
jgi:putative toxin-antitoxin system antitoxin component (TIGR02293 family)